MQAAGHGHPQLSIVINSCIPSLNFKSWILELWEGISKQVLVWAWAVKTGRYRYCWALGGGGESSLLSFGGFVWEVSELAPTFFPHQTSLSLKEGRSKGGCPAAQQQGQGRTSHPMAAAGLPLPSPFPSLPFHLEMQPSFPSLLYSRKQTVLDLGPYLAEGPDPCTEQRSSFWSDTLSMPPDPQAVLLTFWARLYELGTGSWQQS